MIGYELGLPKEFIEKTPSDGLCGKSDEEKLGFTYDELDLYIRGDGSTYDVPHCGWIKCRHRQNLFKMQPIATFDPGLKIVEN